MSPRRPDPAACTILAGPNGSGKSSFYERLQPIGEFVNADVIAREAALSAGEAGRRAIARIEELLRARKDFVFETTLSSHHSVGSCGRRGIWATMSAWSSSP